MNPLLKDPTAAMRYQIAWPPTLLAGAAIADARWRVEPEEADGLIISSTFIDGRETGVHFGGGRAGCRYRLTCRIALSDGRSDDRSLAIRVEHR
jgi:hypothetical protein